MCVISDKSSILGLGGIIGGIKTSTEFEIKISYLSLLISYHHQLEKHLVI